jgi:hypothetical protein
VSGAVVNQTLLVKSRASPPDWTGEMLVAPPYESITFSDARKADAFCRIGDEVATIGKENWKRRATHGAGDDGTGDFSMRSRQRLGLFLTAVFLLLSWGCGGTGSTPAPSTPAPLSACNVNLIFVVSKDLTNNAAGDVNSNTANLTNQGLQRSLRMAPFLKQNVLGGKNVTGIYALEPMTHLQTTGNYPDMVALETIQQFALLNHVTLPSENLGQQYTGNSFPLNASYAFVPPSGVAPPLLFCGGCQGLDFNDENSDNEALVAGPFGILGNNVPGFYVFSSPWETTSSLLANINQLKGYNLTLPASYQGPNYIYAISVTPSGSASLVTFNSNVTPPSTYPVLPSPKLVSSPCTTSAFNIAATGAPQGTNTNETLYLMRHAEAHPTGDWEDANYVAAGQWRALDLPNALRGKISPTQVYSIDPAQVIPDGHNSWSYVRPSLTVEPYAIANNLPYYLISNFELFAQTSPQQTIDFFLKDPRFSGETVLLAWEHEHFPPTVNLLLSSYGSAQRAPAWPDDDYDTIWTVKLDAQSNLTVDNAICEGINSATLPATAPQF